MDEMLFANVFVFIFGLSILPYTTASGEVASTAETKADLLRSCYNKYYNGTASVFEDFLRGFNSSLYLHEVLVSAKRSELPMTIFVGATLERLPALEGQCRNYPGPLSAAIYIPLSQSQHGSQITPENTDTLQKATARVRELFVSLESESKSESGTGADSGPVSCALTVLLLYEVVADPPLRAIVPINTLRNAALLAASTPLVAMVDVDLAPSASLGASVLQPGGNSLDEILRRCAQRTVWVLPAWETHKRLSIEEGVRVADSALRGDKAALRRLVAEELLHYFAKMAYSRGHAPTNFGHWLDSEVPYTVSYEINYEPWFIISRELVPPYDVRFRGYGWNKVQQVALVALSNFTFLVHPHAWLVHRPHEKSGGQLLYGSGAGVRRRVEVREWQGRQASLDRLFHRRVSALRHTAIRDMHRGTYAAAVDPQTRYCRAVLPWWTGLREATWEPGQAQGKGSG